MSITDHNPKMQRRHFERIATIINQLPEEFSKLHLRYMIAEHFAGELRSMNSGFQRDKFIEACMTGNMGKHRSRARSGA